MENLDKRYLCWDNKYIEKMSNIQILMHKPEKKNIALVCDSEWEGECNGYATLIKTPVKYLFYYRATKHKYHADGTPCPSTSVICVAESIDGINFTKPALGLYEFNGSKENNIVFATDKMKIDTFSVFYDENPNCPENERFKALTECAVDSEPRLRCFASADGLHFSERHILSVQGTFDSYNACFWDKDTKQYCLYYRSFHEKDGTEHFNWKGVNDVTSIRDVRLAVSKDFINWTYHGRIKFEAGQEDYPLYTNQISKYYRDNTTFIGFPTRYCDRVADSRSFDFMPLADYRRKVTEHFRREGTALTDCIIMTSSDGIIFNRRDEAFLTPGPENRSNWWYGNCYPAYGMTETRPDEEGGSNEISFYMGENYRIKNVNFRRYTIRLDGFFSWFAPYKGGEILTKTFNVSGDEIYINFSSSSAGGITVSVCDDDGNILDGYRSSVMFGDSTERPVKFKKPLSELKNKSVRLKFELCDSHLYSFEFK